MCGIIGDQKCKVPEDPAPEYHLAFRELDARLRAADGTLADIVVVDSFYITTEFAADVGHLAEERGLYNLGPSFPA